MRFVNSLNAVNDNIWSLLVLAAGVVLCIKGRAAEGGSLITLGAAIFQRTANGDKIKETVAAKAAESPKV